MNPTEIWLIIIQSPKIPQISDTAPWQDRVKEAVTVSSRHYILLHPQPNMWKQLISTVCATFVPPTGGWWETSTVLSQLPGTCGAYMGIITSTGYFGLLGCSLTLCCCPICSVCLPEACQCAAHVNRLPHNCVLSYFVGSLPYKIRLWDQELLYGEKSNQSEDLCPHVLRRPLVTQQTELWLQRCEGSSFWRIVPPTATMEAPLSVSRPANVLSCQSAQTRLITCNSSICLPFLWSTHTHSLSYVISVDIYRVTRISWIVSLLLT